VNPVSAVNRAQTRLLEADVVVVVQVIHADDGVAALEEPQREGGADESGAAGNEHFHGTERGGCVERMGCEGEPLERGGSSVASRGSFSKTAISAKGHEHTTRAPRPI